MRYQTAPLPGQPLIIQLAASGTKVISIRIRMWTLGPKWGTIGGVEFGDLDVGFLADDAIGV